MPAAVKTRTKEQRSPGSGSASSSSSSSHVLPSLRRLLTKPLTGPGWVPPPIKDHITPTDNLSCVSSRDPPDSPPTLKLEPLSTTPKIKQEFVCSDVVEGASKTTSGLRKTPEVRQSRPPPRKRRPEIDAFVNSRDSATGNDAGKVTSSSNGEYPLPNEVQPEPEVERCPSDLSSAPPDIAVDRSPNSETTQRSEGTVTLADRRADYYFAHAPRKRFRYEFLPYVDADGAAVASAGQFTADSAAGVDVGRTGNGNDVINLTTSTRSRTTSDVAVRSATECEGDKRSAESEVRGLNEPRQPAHLPTSPGCRCQTSASFCWHCGILFQDDVLHAIHMGCHSVVDKFVCNVCGAACGDRYGFNSHLVRGHVQATADQSAAAAAGPLQPLQLASTARLIRQTTSLPPSSRPTSTGDPHRWATFDRC